MTPDAFSPMSSGYSPFSPLDGVGTGGGMLGGLGMQMMMQTFMSSAGGLGYAPMGVNDRNLFDRMNHLDMTMQHRQAVQQAAGNDRPMFHQIGRGVANLLGYRYNDAGRQMADLMHSGYQTIAPAIMEIPGAVNFLDSLSPTGNQAAMTHGIFKAGRRMSDPLTGRFGMSGAGSAAITNALFSELYAGDNYMSMPLKSGAFGSMVDELQTRGMGPTLMSGRGAPSSRLQGIFASAGVQVGDISQITAGDRDKLSQLFKSDPSSAAAAYGEMGRFDSKKSADKLKEWAGAVDAMKEIFGDAGNPNAPMAQLLESLNQLTSGGMTQLNPGKLSGIVRTTYNLSQSTGVGMEATGMMTQLGSAYASQMGLAPVFSAFATQGSLSFMQAMQATGGNQHAVWGRSDAQRLMLANQRLTLGAFNSDAANRMGVAMRLGESAGFAAGTDASNYIEAVKNGQTTFMSGGQNRSVNMDEAALASMLAGSSGGKLTSGMVNAMLQQRSANQEFLANNPEAGLAVRRMQGAELFARYGGAATGIIGGFLREKGVKNDKLADKLGSAFSDALASGQLTDEILSDPEKRKAFFQAQFGDKLKGTGLDAGVMGDAAFGEIDRELRSSGQGSLADVLKLFNPHLLEQSDKARATAQAKGVLGGMMAPLGKGSMMSRFMTALIEGGPGVDLKDIALETVGAERGEKIRSMITDDKANELRKQYGLVDAALTAANNEKDPTKKKALMGQAEKLASAYQLEMAKLNKTFVDNGLVGDVAASGDEVLDAADKASELAGKVGKGNRGDLIKALKSYGRQASSLAERGGEGTDEWARLDAAHQELVQTIKHVDPELAKKVELENLLQKEGGDKATSAAGGGDNQVSSVRIYVNDKLIGDGTAEFGHDPTDV